MRCRSYRSWGDALRRNLEASRCIVDDNGPKRNIIKTYVIDYENNTIKREIDSDKKVDKISPSP